MEKANEATQTSKKGDNDQSTKEKVKKPAELSSKREASWPSVLFFIHLNILGLYGIIVLFTQTKLITFLFSKFNKSHLFP